MVLNPREVLFQTAALQQDWEQRLTDTLRDNPVCTGVQVKWRHSMKSGRPLAKPRVLDDTVRTTTRRALRTPAQQKQAEGCGQVRLQGPLGARPEACLTGTMQAVAAKAGLPWAPQKDNRELAPGRRRMHIGQDGLPTGRFDFPLASVPELARLRQAAHGDAVMTNGYRRLLGARPGDTSRPPEMRGSMKPIATLAGPPRCCWRGGTRGATLEEAVHQQRIQHRMRLRQGSF